EAGGSGAGRVADGTAPGLRKGPDSIRRRVRARVGKYQGLLEADHVDGVPAGKCFALDLVEAPLVIEHRDRRATAVCAQDAELTAVDLVYAVGEVDLDLTTFGHRL